MKKLLISSLIILILLGGIFIYSCLPRFYSKNFQEIIEIPYQDEFQETVGDICYGNFFKCQNVDISYTGNVDSNVLKEYLIEYTFTYQKKELKKKQIVKIVDNKAPEINITGETFTYCPNGKIMPINYEAKDNYDGDLTKDVEITIEEDKIVFSVKDSSDSIRNNSYSSRSNRRLTSSKNITNSILLFSIGIT